MFFRGNLSIYFTPFYKNCRLVTHFLILYKNLNPIFEKLQEKFQNHFLALLGRVTINHLASAKVYVHLMICQLCCYSLSNIIKLHLFLQNSFFEKIVIFFLKIFNEKNTRGVVLFQSIILSCQLIQ